MAHGSHRTQEGHSVSGAPNGGSMAPHVAYELLMERLACPNMDAPFHTSLGCSYCIQTEPMVEAVRVLWAELEKEGTRACDEAMGKHDL